MGFGCSEYIASTLGTSPGAANWLASSTPRSHAVRGGRFIELEATAELALVSHIGMCFLLSWKSAVNDDRSVFLRTSCDGAETVGAPRKVVDEIDGLMAIPKHPHSGEREQSRGHRASERDREKKRLFGKIGLHACEKPSVFGAGEKKSIGEQPRYFLGICRERDRGTLLFSAP